jgi:hypothetical protein
MLDVLVLAQDIATAACGSFNAIHFLGYWLGRDTARSRRVAAAALTVINAAVVVESLFFLALYWTHRWQGSIDLFLSPPVWISARTLLLLGAAFISALILRQQRQR